MDHHYIELQEWEAELDQLLGPVTQMKDTVTHQTFSLGQSTDMLLEEIEDFDIYETRMNMVNGDLLKHFDNPSLPSNLERMTMLDRLGETLWYDKWIHERAAQFAELEDLDMGTIDLGITNQAQSLAKERVTDIFEGLEMAEVPKKDSLDALAEWAEENDVMIDAQEAAEYNEIYDVPQMSIGRSSSVAAMEDAGIEMVELVEQTVNLSETVRELQLVNDAHVFFGIDETTARFSQTALDAFEGVATTGPVGYGWDLWPTVEEMVGLGQSIATGAAGALVMYGLVEGLTPIIKSLGDTDWIRGGYSVETKESVSMTDSITSSMLGPMYKISQRIAKHLEDHPTYVWFLDNFNARVSKKKETHYIIWDFIRDPPCSTFWLRGRVIAMEGKKVGYSDSPSQLMLGVKLTLTKTDMAPNNQTFWVNAETAVVLRDGAAVQHACNTKNLANMIFNSWGKYPLLNPVDPPPPPPKNIVDDVHPKDLNGKRIYEADRVFSLRDLTFSNVESTRKTRVVTYNSDTEQTNTYFAENLIVVQWFDSEADIYRKYKAQFDVSDDTGAVLPEDFAYNDAKGRLIRIGDTVKTIEADSVTSRVIGLYSGRVEVDYGGSTTTYVPSFLVVVSKSHDGQPVPPVPQPTVPPVPPEPTVPVPPEPTVPVPPVPTVPVPPVPPKKVEPFVGPRKPTVPTVPQRVQPIVVPIMPTKVLPPPPPDEFYDGEWPLFNQKKMALKPAKETHIETNTGIAVNAFNMFRRRLPGVIGGQVGGAAKILEAQKVGGQAGGGIRREEKKSVTDDDASSTMSSSTNSWDSIEPTGSGGGGGAGILIAGLIVALIIFQSSS